MKVARTFAVVLLLAGMLRGLAGQAQSASPSPSPTPSSSPTPSEAVKRSVVISAGVAEGLRLKYVQPEYPREAIKKHIKGNVFLQATIDREGNTTNIRVVKGDPILAQSAIKAVRQWKFKAFVLNGETVEAKTQFTIKYHM